jgi:protein SCO1/2
MFRFITVFAYLAFLLAMGPGAALGEEQGHRHGNGHGHDHGDDHSHHHGGKAAQEGYKKLVASYDIPDVTLTGTDGSRVRLREALAPGKPVMLNFIFTTCTTICPIITAVTSSARENLGADKNKIRAVSITIDPEYDTPAVMNEYAKRFSADPGWLFLTGNLPDIVKVQRAFDAYRGNKMNHAPLTFLRASGGGQWTRLDGIMSAEELEREAKAIIPDR